MSVAVVRAAGLSDYLGKVATDTSCRFAGSHEAQARFRRGFGRGWVCRLRDNAEFAVRRRLHNVETIFTMPRLNINDEDSLETVFHTHGKDLYRFLFRLAGNCQDAEDLTQDTFLSVLIKLPHFKGESSVKTWIYAIAINKFRDALRSGKVRGHAALQPDETISSDNPLRALIKTETRARVRKAFHDLPAHFKEALVLVRFEGMSYRDAAKVLGTTSDGIRMRVHRAHLMLAAQLRDK